MMDVQFPASGVLLAAGHSGEVPGVFSFTAKSRYRTTTSTFKLLSSTTCIVCPTSRINEARPLRLRWTTHVTRGSGLGFLYGNILTHTAIYMVIRAPSFLSAGCWSCPPQIIYSSPPRSAGNPQTIWSSGFPAEITREGGGEIARLVFVDMITRWSPASAAP